MWVAAVRETGLRRCDTSVNKKHLSQRLTTDRALGHNYCIHLTNAFYEHELGQHAVFPLNHVRANYHQHACSHKSRSFIQDEPSHSAIHLQLCASQAAACFLRMLDTSPDGAT
jgi:hypothetical protein